VSVDIVPVLRRLSKENIHSSLREHFVLDRICRWRTPQGVKQNTIVLLSVADSWRQWTRRLGDPPEWCPSVITKDLRTSWQVDADPDAGKKYVVGRVSGLVRAS